MYQYPAYEDFQLALPTLRSALKGEAVASKDVIHACYVSLGFGLTLYPGAPSGFGAAAPDEEAVALIDAALEHTDGAAAINWAVLLPVVLQLLQTFLNK